MTAVLLSLLLAGPVPCAAAPDPAACSVFIRYGSAAGSGTCVACEGGHSLVLTNAHVCPDQGVRVAVDAGGKTYQGFVVYSEGAARGADLAAVFVWGELPAARLADAEPAVGCAVCQYGHPWHRNGGLMPKTGTFLGVAPFREQSGERVVETTVVSESGDSGSGVFVGSELVAVTWGGSGGRACCVPLAAVRRVLGHVARGLGDHFPRLKDRLATEAPRMPAPAPVRIVGGS